MAQSRIALLQKDKAPLPTDQGWLREAGPTVPSDAVAGYQPSAIFQDNDSGVLYVNVGTFASANFDALVPAAAMSGHVTMSDAGVVTIAGVSKEFTRALTDLRTAGSSAAAKDPLPDAAAGDGASLGLADAGLVVIGTSTNNSDATEYCQFDFVVPEDYIAGNNLTVRVRGHLTAASAVQSDLDVVVKHKKAGALDATDLCTTTAIDWKAVVAAADHDFAVNSVATGDEVTPGDVLNIVIAAQRDNTGAAVAGLVNIDKVSVLCNCYR